MNTPRLVLPSSRFLEGYLEACREFQAQPSPYIGSLHNPDTYEEWKDTLLPQLKQQREGSNLPQGWVPSTTYWLVKGEAFVGLGSIRHRLTPALEEFGGHIGYSIRPSRQGQGYGTLQLRLLLEKAWEMGIGQALITCNRENTGSRRVIEKNGGQLWDVIENRLEGHGSMTCRYWVPTLLPFTPEL